MTDLHTLRLEQPERIAVIYRHYLIKQHPYALKASQAAECAADQGKFEAFHDALFAHQDSIGILSWKKFAAAAGVQDLPLFDSCVEKNLRSSAILTDLAAARKLKVSATPTFLMNDLRFGGAIPLDSLRSFLDRSEAKLH